MRSSWSSLASTACSAKRASRRSSAAGRGRRCDINGLTSGYQGEGAKTVLPARASAKFSFRLVPNQDPTQDRRRRCEVFSKSGCRRAFEMELVDHHGAPGVVVPLDSPYMRAAAAAIEAGFGRAPVFIREGGSIPIVNTFARRAGRRRAAVGLGPERRQHAQPERKILARRLPPRHAGQRASCGRNWRSVAPKRNAKK